MTTEAKLSARDNAILQIVQAATSAKPATIHGLQLGLMATGHGRPKARCIRGAIRSLIEAGLLEATDARLSSIDL